MDKPGIGEQLPELCERNAPPFDEADFSGRLRRKTNRSRRHASAPRRRSGLRIAVYASVAVALAAAVTIGTVEAVKYVNKDQHILVIGDEPMITTKTSGLYPVRIDGKWGYIDNTGAVKIEPQFDSANDFSEGLARVVLTKNGETKQGYVDTSGAIVIQPQFNYAEDFSEGMAVVGELDDDGNPRSGGYIDTSGALVIPMQYEGAGAFSGGLGVVSNGNSRFFIDKAGATVLGPYDFPWDFSEGLAYVEDGGRRGFIDSNGDWVADLESAVFDMSSYLSSQFPFPGSAQGFSEGLMALQSTSGMSPPKMGRADKGYVDKTGAWVIEPRFNHACDFSEGLAAVGVTKNGDLKWGYIDQTGAWVIQPQFEYTWRFAEGLAVVGVTENGYMKYGYIDKTGTVVIPMQYAQARDFSGGIAGVVSQSDAYSGYPSYIDRTGKVIWQGQ
jgi:hypothetical protein